MAVERVPKYESITAADYTRRFQFAGDAASGVSRSQHHELLATGRQGHQQAISQPSCDSKQQQEREQEKLPHSPSLEDE
jgi:hypothetical protein